ncbi:hypothetical protein D3C87_1023180 [compost metagenome]
MVSGLNLFTAKTATPSNEPSHKVYWADLADAFFQKTPSKNTQVMGGAMCAITSLMPSNKLVYWLSNGNNAKETSKAIAADKRPTVTSLTSLALG